MPKWNQGMVIQRQSTISLRDPEKWAGFEPIPNTNFLRSRETGEVINMPPHWEYKSTLRPNPIGNVAETCFKIENGTYNYEVFGAGSTHYGFAFDTEEARDEAVELLEECAPVWPFEIHEYMTDCGATTYGM